VRWLAVLLTLLCSFPAVAGVYLVPGPPLVADGSTQSIVRFYVDDGARIKVKAEGGKTGPAIAGTDGVWSIPFTPSRASTIGTVPFKITASGAETTFDVPVVPPFAGSVSLSFDPPAVSGTGTATVKIEPSGSTPIAAEGRRFLLSASVGTIEAAVPTGNNTWIARYTPPKGLTAPVGVVISAADAAAPEAIYGTALLPVTVKRSVSFDALAGSSNVLRVGSRSYGPIVAAPSGKVAFDVELDPREAKGDLRSINPDTSKVDKEVDLPVTAGRVIAFLPVASSVPAQSSLAIPIRLSVLTSTGDVIKTGTPIKLTTTGGTISSPVLTGELYVATFNPPSTPGEVTISAEIEGIKVDKKIKLVGSVPTVLLSGNDITKTGTTFSVTARVKDAQGTGVIGKPPVVTASGATSGGSAKDNKDGSYTFPFKVGSSVNSVRLYAAPAVDVSSSPAARIVAWPASAMVAANGTEVVTITVLAVDAYGLPVPNVTFKLGAPKGDGSVPPSITTDARGMGRITFTAGKTPGVVSVRIEGAGMVTEVPLYQAKDGVGPILPGGGGPVEEALVQRWQAAAPELRLLRDGVIPPAGPPALVAISTIPPYTTPGAAILLNIRVSDASGMGVGGKKLAISAPPAVVGQITDNRDGTYAVPLQLPAGVDGPISLTVGADSATGQIVLPTLAQMGAQQPVANTGGGATTGGTRQPTASGGTPGRTTAPRPMPTTTEWSKLRLGGALHNVRGTYGMESNAGAQLLGAADFATPGAGFWGVGVEAVYLPLNADWGSLGVDARGRGQLEWFNVGDTPFINVQRDAILGARYRRGFGPLFSLEGSLAFHYTTGVLFRYADAARTQAEILNFPLFGARLGVLATLETDKVYASVEFAETFAPFPIDTHAEATVDIEVSDSGTAIRVGGGWDYRSMAYVAEGDGDDEGTADVEQSQFTVRVGMAQAF
jgi:hypothetical protein